MKRKQRKYKNRKKQEREAENQRLLEARGMKQLESMFGNTNSGSAPDANGSRGVSRYDVIPPWHLVWTTEQWFELLLDDLPLRLLRWLGCDYAAYELELLANAIGAMEIDFRTHKALDVGYRFALGLVSVEDLLDADELAWQVYHTISHYDAAWCVFLALDGDAQKACWRAVLQYPWRDDGGRMNPSLYGDIGFATRQDQHAWVLARLRYLCTVWNSCRERGLQLLYDGKCPVLWEAPS